MIVDLVFGFLGSGKTTFITKMLQEWKTTEKVVVLVNEFGDVGIDGELFSSMDTTVVEMPSGCICCTLQSDFKNQFLEIERFHKPDRIVIEPTGVATIAQIQRILEVQVCEEKISHLNNILITDATGFMKFYKSNRHFVESQIQHAHIALINKCDRVNKHQTMLIRSSLLSVNPEVTVFLTQYGKLDWEDYQFTLAKLNAAKPKLPDKDQTGIAINNLKDSKNYNHPNTLHSGISLMENLPNLGFESFGTIFENNSFQKDRLESFFRQMTDNVSQYGKIVRAKGIFKVDTKWRIIELASKEVSSLPIRFAGESKVTIIGTDLKKDRIRTALDQCIAV